jgi:hypothetical protein
LARKIFGAAKLKTFSGGQDDGFELSTCMRASLPATPFSTKAVQKHIIKTAQRIFKNQNKMTGQIAST